MVIRALLPDELDNWFDYLARSYPVSRSEVERRWSSDPDQSPDRIRVAVVDGQIRSTLRIYARQIYLAGHAVPVGGIGLVCTDPAYRGQGLASALLVDSLRQMAASGVALSVLFAERHELYAEHGWKPVPVETATAWLTPAPGPYAIGVANLRDPAEVRQLQQYYDRSARQCQGTTRRTDPAYWAGWIASTRRQAVAARSHGRLVGYLAASWTDDGTLYIEDFAGEPAEAQALIPALLAGLVKDRSLEPIRVTYPPALLPHLEPIARQQDASPMYRMIRPHELPLEAAQALHHLLEGDLAGHLIWPADRY